MQQQNIRNIAIIAHVDHGKTTLVDVMFKQSGLFRKNQTVTERMMDSNELEKERGITILSKNTAVMYKDIKVNIVDTPGHADFGGEVERIMQMVDGVLLLVDAYEGPMPQTRFVLKKAMDNNLPVITVINKIDRPNARLAQVQDSLLDLFIELSDEHASLEMPLIYASSKDGYAIKNLEDTPKDLTPLFDMIVDVIPPPAGDANRPLSMLISTIDYDSYTGRIGIGKILQGKLNLRQSCVVCNPSGKRLETDIRALYRFEGLKRIACETASTGDIVAVSGLEDIAIGDTVCEPESVEPLDFIKIDEPSISMVFAVNDSPLAGKEGRFVTSRHLNRRLFREMEKDVSLRVEPTDQADSFRVFGRGELHLSILIETMRREGYEFQVSKPVAVMKKTDQGWVEPFEQVYIEVPDSYAGAVIEKLGSRKGEMTSMKSSSEGYVQMEFSIPARGLLGYRQEFMTDTGGTGVMYASFLEYGPTKGEISFRKKGSLVAFESGTAVTYGLFSAQQRGELFISPGVEVYEGMVVGINGRQDDMTVNVCKKKHLTSVRNVQAEDPLRLTTPITLSLEQAIEFIKEDEWIEITPRTFRIRKTILKKEKRERLAKRNRASS